MSFLDSIFLGLLQGFTEFLPISSSGHLVLAEHFFQINLNASDMKAFDVILHSGTLLALIFYFRNDWMIMLKEGIRGIQKKNVGESLLFKIIIATIPAAIVGVLLNEWIDDIFRDPRVVALMMFIVGIIFFLCEKFPSKKEKSIPTYRQGFIIGIAQVVALIPGISRSGSTIAAAMFQGIARHDAAKFSFLLGTPAIAGATLLIGIKIMEGLYILPPFSIVAAGFFASAISSFFCIHFLLQFVRTYSLRIFGLYLLIIPTLSLLYAFLFSE